MTVMTVMVAVANAADFCLTDSDCEEDTGSEGRGRGRTCVRLYDGCFVGRCMCPSHQSVVGSADGRCVDGKTRRMAVRAELSTQALGPFAPWFNVCIVVGSVVEVVIGI